MKPLITILFILLLSAQTCKKQDSKPAMSTFRHWVHSFEEDTADIQVYRPVSYKFPLAEGREGFEIKQNGEIILYGISPSDSPKKSYGTWTSTQENKIDIQLQTPQATTYQIQIIELSDTLLKVHKINK